MSDPFVTLHKQDAERRVWLVDMDAWIAQGWSLDPSEVKTPEPVQSESATVADLEPQTKPQPEPEKQPEKPEPKRKPSPKHD